ncbi:MAG TPA: DUF4105 domain-containing protein [Flavobacterium sp.]|jgi:hypothetical protein
MHPFKSLLLLIFFSISPLYSQYLPLSESAEVSLLTCGKGDQLYSLFGHTAIRINDVGRNIDFVYNYGAFDFDTPNFVVRFSKGDLQYFVTKDPFLDFMYTYQYEQRSVYEQYLSMPLEQKQQLFDALNKSLESDKKYYTYKFIDRNCTTMVADILNAALADNSLRKVREVDADVTYREVLYPYFDQHFYEQLGTSIIFGSKVDEKADKVFLPEELLESVNVAKVDGRPLLQKSRTLLQFPAPKNEMSWWNNPYTYILLMLLIVLANSRIVTVVYFIVAGALGLFFTVAGSYSYHGELAYNYNALLFNPALLLIAFFLISKNMKAVYYLAIFCLIGFLVYFLIMLNKVHLLIVLPVLIAHLFLIGRLVRRYRAHFIAAAKV